MAENPQPMAARRGPLPVPSGGSEVHYGEYRALRFESAAAMIQALLCKFNLRHEWHLEHPDDGTV